MDLKVPYSKITDKNKGFESAKKLIPEVAAKFGIKAETEMDEGSKTVSAKGKGFSANLEFTDTHAIVSLDLAFLLKPLKGKILSTIEEELKKVV